MNTNWEDFKGCMYAEKHWVKNEDGELVDYDSHYEQGCFLAVWCGLYGMYCDALSVDMCTILEKQNKD